MKRIFFVFLLLGLSQIALAGDDEDNLKRFSAFGGYSHFIPDKDGTNADGINASITGYLTPWLGLTGEIATQTNDTTRYTQYLFGIEMRFRAEKRIEPYMHMLFGGLSNSATSGYAKSTTDFIYGPGVGLNIKIKNYLFIRPIQADLLATPQISPYGTVDYGKIHARISSGVVFRF
jgi:hypothetical protein